MNAKQATPKRPTKQVSSRGKRAPKTAGASNRNAKRKHKAPVELEAEISRLAGRRAPKLLDAIMEAQIALSQDRDRDVVSILSPVKREIPDSLTVRELLGTAKYRLGRYKVALEELEFASEISGNLENYPMMMDCYRALERYRKVGELWQELREVSPSAELVTEGRIVAAGSLADAGSFGAAIALLAKKANVRRAEPHHMRLWYALADLHERSGNPAAARSLFARIAKQDPNFFDVKERLQAL